MTKITWWETDRLTAMGNRTPKGNIRKKYFKTQFNESLLKDWSEDVDIKYLKASYGTGNRIELQIYNSFNYSTYKQKINKQMPIIKDKYFIVLQGLKFKTSKSASAAVREIEEIKTKLSSLSMMKEENWLTFEETMDALERINGLLENLDAYDVMDSLLGDTV